jgi:hypothetical protein
MSTNFKKKQTTRTRSEEYVQRRRALEKDCQGEVSSSGRRRAIMPRRRRDTMGMRKLKVFLKNTFYRKRNGNLISQLKILIQNQAVFSTLRFEIE